MSEISNGRSVSQTAPPTSLLRSLCRSAFVVYIFQRNKLRQALSKARAVQTDLWKVQNDKTAQREPQLDPELIEQCLKEAVQQEKAWGHFFPRIGIDPLRVEYEKLCENYEVTIRGVLDFLKISLRRNTPIDPPVTVRQANEISRAWEERFLAERPSTLAQI